MYIFHHPVVAQNVAIVLQISLLGVVFLVLSSSICVSHLGVVCSRVVENQKVQLVPYVLLRSARDWEWSLTVADRSHQQHALKVEGKEGGTKEEMKEGRVSMTPSRV